MKKLLSIIFMLIFSFCLVSCNMPNQKPTDDNDEEIKDEIKDDEDESNNMCKVTFVDENGEVLGTKSIEKGYRLDEPSYTIEGYDTVAWLHEGVIWNFRSNKVQSDMTLVLVTKKHEHNFFNGICSCGKTYGKHEVLNLSPSELTNLSAEVTFWHTMGQSKQVILDEIIEVFNEYYPNIKVTHASQGSYIDLRDKIAKSIRIKTQPTIAQVYSDDIMLYMSSNTNITNAGVRDLDAFINHPTVGLTAEQLDDYVPSYFAEGKIYDNVGTCYSLPFNKSTEVLFINASWFRQEGLLEKYNLGSIVTENGKEVFKANEGAHLSWEDIEEIGKHFINTKEYYALSEKEKLNNYAFSYDSEENMFITLTKQWGGEYTKLTGENQGEFLFNNDQSKAAIKWYYDAFKSGYFITASAWGDPDAYTSDKFTSEQVKMVISLSNSASYNDPQGKFVVGVLPYPQKEATYATGENQYVIQQGTNIALFNSETAEEELAGWLFMKFLTTWTPGLAFEKQPTFMWCDGTGSLPILNSLRNSEKYDLSLRGYDEHGVYVGQSLNNLALLVGWEQRYNYYTTPSFPGTSTCNDVVENLVEGVLYGAQSIEEAYRHALSYLI